MNDIHRWIEELRSGDRERIKTAAMRLRSHGPSAKPALTELRAALGRVDAMKQAVISDGSVSANPQAADSVGDFFQALQEVEIVLRAVIADIRDW